MMQKIKKKIRERKEGNFMVDSQHNSSDNTASGVLLSEEVLSFCSQPI